MLLNVMHYIIKPRKFYILSLIYFQVLLALLHTVLIYILS